ncbi:MAG: hypothetical protein NT157_03440 [Candidatus Micrarchaeota archaeon]|nr:hypothetical protein [Candidatus Micrarchaeota archaeon]
MTEKAQSEIGRLANILNTVGAVEPQDVVKRVSHLEPADLLKLFADTRPPAAREAILEVAKRKLENEKTLSPFAHTMLLVISGVKGREGELASEMLKLHASRDAPSWGDAGPANTFLRGSGGAPLPNGVKGKLKS